MMRKLPEILQRTEPLKSKRQSFVLQGQGSIKKGKYLGIITMACGWWGYDKTKSILVSFKNPLRYLKGIFFISKMVSLRYWKSFRYLYWTLTKLTMLRSEGNMERDICPWNVCPGDKSLSTKMSYLIPLCNKRQKQAVAEVMPSSYSA